MICSPYSNVKRVNFRLVGCSFFSTLLGYKVYRGKFKTIAHANTMNPTTNQTAVKFTSGNVSVKITAPNHISVETEVSGNIVTECSLSRLFASLQQLADFINSWSNQLSKQPSQTSLATSSVKDTNPKTTLKRKPRDVYRLKKVVCTDENALSGWPDKTSPQTE